MYWLSIGTFFSEIMVRSTRGITLFYKVPHFLLNENTLEPHDTIDIVIDTLISRIDDYISSWYHTFLLVSSVNLARYARPLCCFSLSSRNSLVFEIPCNNARKPNEYRSLKVMWNTDIIFKHGYLMKIPIESFQKKLSIVLTYTKRLTFVFFPKNNENLFK